MAERIRTTPKIIHLVLPLVLLFPAVPLIAASMKSKESSIKPLSGAALRKQPSKQHSGRDLRIEVKGEYKGLVGDADFVIADGSQSNHVAGGDRAFKVKTSTGEGLEFKRWGFIVNALPVVDQSNPNKINMQLQIEISGPVEGKDGIDIDTWQFQSEFWVLKGKWKKIAAKPAKVSICVSDAQDE